MESNAQSGNAQHRKIIRSVTHSNGLCNVYLLYLCNEAQQFGFSLTVHHISQITAGQLTVHYFQFIGIYIINAIFLLKILPEISETTGKNGYLVTILFQYIHQAVYTFRNGQILCYFLHDRFIQTFQQSYTLTETFSKIYLTTHSTLSDGFHLIAHTSAYSQFVNYFRFNQSRIHIETDQSAHPAIHIIKLEREIHFQFARQLH